MTEVTNFIISLLNISLYVTSLVIFGAFLMFMYRRMAPMLLNGKTRFNDVLSILTGTLVLLAMIMLMPQAIAKAVQYGFLEFMPVMQDTAQVVVDGASDILNGTSPNYVSPEMPEYIPPTSTPQMQSTNPNIHNSGGFGNNPDMSWLPTEPTVEPQWNPDMNAPTPEG